MRRWLTIVCSCVVGAASLAQETRSQSYTKTGPPSGHGVGPSGPMRSMPVRPSRAPVPDAVDIRANQVVSSAQNETAIAVNPLDSNNWVGVANDYRMGGVQAGWFTTFDGGETWATGTFGVDPGFTIAGDPTVCFTPEGDPVAICVMWAGPGGNKVTAFRSRDGGRTWGEGVRVNLRILNDKPQMACDLTPSSPHYGYITVAWNRFGMTEDIFVSTSKDGGVTWSRAQQLNGPNGIFAFAADVTYGPRGELYVTWATRGEDPKIWIDRSFDGGVTWSDDFEVTPFVPVPMHLDNSTFRLFDVFAVAADRSDGPYSGRVYVAYHDIATGSGDVRVVASDDRGTTWGPSVLVHDVSDADQVMPGLTVDERGNVNVAFLDRRLDAENYLLWTWVARSFDGGASFVDYRASDVGWDHRATEFGGGFIGDYIDIESSRTLVHPFWCDGRSGSQDVYTDALNLDLQRSRASLHASEGGDVDFEVQVGPNHAGDEYVLLLGASGTAPGRDLPSGVHVPLNPDAWTDFSQRFANSPFLVESRGVLQQGGTARVRLDTRGPRPSLGGLELFASLLVLRGGVPVHSTAPVSVIFES